jgi:hypothetical protein
MNEMKVNDLIKLLQSMDVEDTFVFLGTSYELTECKPVHSVRYFPNLEGEGSMVVID